MAGAKPADLCRRRGSVATTSYRWKAKFGNMVVSDAERLRHLEDGNPPLERLVSRPTLDEKALRDIIYRDWESPPLDEKPPSIHVGGTT